MPKHSVTDKTLAEIGQRLRWMREALGHTQADWARILNIRASELNRWEQGRRLPNINTLITICDASGATFDYLIRGRVGTDMHPQLALLLHQEHPQDLVFYPSPLSVPA